MWYFLSSAVVDNIISGNNTPANENWWLSEPNEYADGFLAGFLVAFGCWVAIKLFKFFYRWIIKIVSTPNNESDK